MDPRKAAALVALFALGGVAVFEATRDVPPDTKPLDREVPLAPEKLAKLPDAGKGYVVEVLTDAGAELRITTAKCVRALKGAPTCLRRELDGGARFFGELNRFPATEAAGFGCESVACSVYAGEDADASEDDVLASERGGR